jgi:HEPN domain-containing protein
MSFDEIEILKDRAYAFFENSKRLLQEGQYDLAAFNIEQFCQLIIKYKLLMKTGAYPHIHSTVRLLRALGKAVPNLKVESFIEKNVMYLTKIDDAYIGARYLPRRYEKGEVEQLIKFVEEEFIGFVEGI